MPELITDNLFVLVPTKPRQKLADKGHAINEAIFFQHLKATQSKDEIARELKKVKLGLKM